MTDISAERLETMMAKAWWNHHDFSSGIISKDLSYTLKMSRVPAPHEFSRLMKRLQLDYIALLDSTDIQAAEVLLNLPVKEEENIEEYKKRMLRENAEINTVQP